MVEDGPIRVLIVDDHVMVAQSLAEALGGEPDIEVAGVAATAADALRLAVEQRPDVVLMDYRLPDGDGAHTAGAIKERVPEAQIVMVTASADEPVLVEAIDAGCSGFITKDRALDEVTSAVRAAAAGEALISPAMLAHLLPRLRGGTRSGPGSTLTQREMQVLELMAQGMSNQEIAAQLVLALNTVRNHVQSLLGKLGAHSKLEAVATAARQGWVKFPRELTSL